MQIIENGEPKWVMPDSCCEFRDVRWPCGAPAMWYFEQCNCNVAYLERLYMNSRQAQYDREMMKDEQDGEYEHEGM